MDNVNEMDTLLELVNIPPRDQINGGKRSCPTGMLVKRYGPPRQRLTDDCEKVTAPFWKSRMVTKSVGPFRASGHRLAVALLTVSLAKVKLRHPELYKDLGSAGMLCCRRVRGSTALSNHGLGLAIDFNFRGRLDSRGDGKCQRAMLLLYSVMKEDGWYWGAEFPTEDSMHFEVSAEKVQEWIDAGIF